MYNICSSFVVDTYVYVSMNVKREREGEARKRGRGGNSLDRRGRLAVAVEQSNVRAGIAVERAIPCGRTKGRYARSREI